MNRIKIFCASILFFLAWTPTGAFAEARNLYVGDIVTLEIESQIYTAEEIRQKFDGFEIMEMEKISNGYRLSLRTFDTGEKTILLGDKELTIHIHSTLDDIHRDSVFEGGAELLEAGFPFHWRILLCAALCVFGASGIFVLAKANKNRKIKTESHYQLFLRRAASLPVKEDHYLVDLTFYFKEYVGALYGRRIIGKTSSEIVDELKSFPALDPLLPFIQKWLTECDQFKFAGGEVSFDDKRLHYGRLLRIAEAIETGPYGVYKETA